MTGKTKTMSPDAGMTRRTALTAAAATIAAASAIV